MFKPWQSLLVLLLFFAGFALLLRILPSSSLQVTPQFALHFPEWSGLFSAPEPKTDITRILKAAEAAEKEAEQEAQVETAPQTATKRDSAKRFVRTQQRMAARRDEQVGLITSIQSANKKALQTFFTALQDLERNPDKKIRVLHYGDSQIEGDRLTDQLRNRFQAEFGGSGPGLVSFLPLAASLINRVSGTGSWERYSAGTGKDKRVEHRNYGPMISFSRFIPYRKLTDTTRAQTAFLNILTTRSGGKEVMNYQTIKVFYGGAQRKTWCEFYDGPALMAADSLNAGGVLNVKEFKAGNGSFNHRFKFRGKDSPDFYALSLESDNGILFDNIALRGSSGTFFHQLNPEQLKQFYSYLNVKLIILQFGGNALPFITNDTLARNYVSWLKGQINLVKRMAPEASILFVGPADMSVKEGTNYVTHPYLELLRSQLKAMVLASNCAYFDMYDCMGGRNSMPAWVNEKLAAPDYIHFTPQGARKVALLLHGALINAYRDFTEQE